MQPLVVLRQVGVEALGALAQGLLVLVCERLVALVRGLDVLVELLRIVTPG